MIPLRPGDCVQVWLALQLIEVFRVYRTRTGKFVVQGTLYGDAGYDAINGGPDADVCYPGSDGASTVSCTVL